MIDLSFIKKYGLNELHQYENEILTKIHYSHSSSSDKFRCIIQDKDNYILFYAFQSWCFLHLFYYTKYKQIVEVLFDNTDRSFLFRTFIKENIDELLKRPIFNILEKLRISAYVNRTD